MALSVLYIRLKKPVVLVSNYYFKPIINVGFDIPKDTPTNISVKRFF